MTPPYEELVERVALTLIATRFDRERYPHLKTDGMTFAYQCKGEDREVWKNALIEARAAIVALSEQSPNTKDVG